MNNSMKTSFLVFFFFSIGYLGLSQEHEHHTDTSPARKTRPAPKPKKSALPSGDRSEKPVKQNSDTTHPMEHEQMQHDSLLMTHAYSRNLPMSRNGSGTAWVPDTSPM